MANYTDITNTLNFSVAFNPTSAFPIDARSMFGSYAAAQAAAASAKNAGSSESKYYYGETVTVFANDVATQYIIQGNNTLKEVGRATLGDDKSIVLDNNGVLSLKSFGVEYYKYNDADVIIAPGSYVYPANMPTGATDGSYIKLANVWYKQTAGAWGVYGGAEPHAEAYYVKTTGWKAGLSPKVVAGTGAGVFELAWYEPSNLTVEGLSSSISTLNTQVSNIDTRVSTAEVNITANINGLAAEVKRATDAETAISGRVTTAEGAITVLNGDSTIAGSVQKQVADGIAAIIAGAPTSFDTLKEISDWISTHGKDAAAMNSAIATNTADITALEKLVGPLPAGITATTVIGYIAEAIAVETNRATTAEGGLDTRIAAIKVITDALGTASKKDVSFFATAAQGAKADTAVQDVKASVNNGKIDVDGVDVNVYTLPALTADVLGGAKIDGTTMTATAAGVISVNAIPTTKVTGLDTAISTSAANALADSKTYTDTSAVAKTSVVTAAALTKDVATASDTEVVSEKALISSLTWKTTM